MKTDAERPTQSAADAPPVPLSATVFSSFDELAPMRDEWNRFADRAGASAFLSYEICSVWWSHYGGGRRLAVFVFREGTELAGIVPMFVERRWLGPVWLRTAGLVGSDMPFVQDPPIAAARAKEVFAETIARLLRDFGCDAVKFAPLSGAYEHTGALREAANGLGALGRVFRDAETGPHTNLYLPASFDAYVASLSKGHRSNYKRSVKLLREAYDVQTDVLTGAAEMEAEFEKFMRLHAEQWAAEGKLGHFGDWPGSEAYHRNLVRTLAPLGRAHMVRLLLDGQVVSYQLCYSFGKWLHWFLPARAARPELERFSLGKFGVFQIVEFAIPAGFTTVEEGVGHYDYKVQLGGTEHAVRSIVVVAAGGGTSLRLSLFLRLSRALDLVYYRGWFQRIAPKLPFPRRPLWKLWIRSRL